MKSAATRQPSPAAPATTITDQAARRKLPSGLRWHASNAFDAPAHPRYTATIGNCVSLTVFGLTAEQRFQAIAQGIGQSLRVGSPSSSIEEAQRHAEALGARLLWDALGESDPDDLVAGATAAQLEVLAAAVQRELLDRRRTRGSQP